MKIRLASDLKSATLNVRRQQNSQHVAKFLNPKSYYSQIEGQNTDISIDARTWKAYYLKLFMKKVFENIFY